MPEELHEGVAWLITEHGAYRMGARQISIDAVQHVLHYGRTVWTRGARIFAIGQKEVRRFRAVGVDLRPFAGVRVVTSPDGAILTAYRRHDFRDLRRPGHRLRRNNARFQVVLPELDPGC